MFGYTVADWDQWRGNLLKYPRALPVTCMIICRQKRKTRNWTEAAGAGLTVGY